MGAYVYAIRSKKPVTAEDLKGNIVLMNHAPFIEKYSTWRNRETWEDVDSFMVRPLNGIVTRAEKYDDNGELTDLVTFDEPKQNPTYRFGDEQIVEGGLQVYNRDRNVAWFDEPDYNREGVVALAKYLPQENPKLKKKKLLFVNRFGYHDNVLIRVDNVSNTFESPVFHCSSWDWEEKKWNKMITLLYKEDIEFLGLERPEGVKPY